MDIRSLGYRTDVMVRRLEGSQVSDLGDCLIVRSPAQPDYWWGNFLLIREAGPEAGPAGGASRWLARFAEVLPEAGHVAIGVDAADASQIDPSGFAAAGLSTDRGIVMTAGTPAVPRHLAADVEVRPLVGGDDWRQSAELRIACQEPGEPAGPEHAEFLRRRAGIGRALTEAGHGAWFGAFRDGRLLAQTGIVWGRGDGPARYQDVQTHPQARRQGLAGTVVHQAGLHALRQAAARTLVIVADPAGGAVRLYRSLGFRDTEDQIGFAQPPAAG